MILFYIEIWNFKLMLETETWNWNLKLKLKLKLEIETWNWNLKLKKKGNVTKMMNFHHVHKFSLQLWIYMMNFQKNKND